MNNNSLLILITFVFWSGFAIAVKVSKSTTSLFPVIPFVPIILLGGGLLLNHFLPPWGTIMASVVHVALIILFATLLFQWRKNSGTREG